MQQVAMIKKIDIASQLKNITNQFRQFIDAEFQNDSSDYIENLSKKIDENVLSLLDVEKPKDILRFLYLERLRQERVI